MFSFYLVRRRSNIVKEMEKMKNKREEKRAQISEIRTRRAQVEYSMPIRGNYKVIQPGS